MRGADAMFLYFEKKSMPLHIGSVSVLDGPFDEECERMIEARLPEIPRYRQRVLFPPFNIAHPVWRTIRNSTFAITSAVYNWIRPATTRNWRNSRVVFSLR